ncbi:MAG: DNA mismatch repair protein MutS [Acidobacteria bacterium]|nr:DNA mismatch repair protein MutS [Acidobacteriota bacterium]
MPPPLPSGHNAPVAACPVDEYRTRLARLKAAGDTLSRRDLRFSYVRLTVFLAGALLAAGAWGGALSYWWPAVPAGLFAVLVERHDRVVRARAAVRRSVAFYERGLARIEDRWAGTGEPGDRFQDDHHPYGNDLDLFGHGSLFELLSIARTRAGEETLAAWLTRAAAAGEIHVRRDAVTELAAALDVRERVALAGAELRASVETDALIAWAEGPPQLTGLWSRGAAWVLTATVVSAAVYAFASGNWGPLLAGLVVQALFSIPQRARIQQALHAAGGPARDLDVLAHVLDALERGPFASERLAALKRGLETAGVPASTAIRRLHRLVELHDWQHNQFFAPVAAALLWGTHLAWAIEAWRRLHGAHVRGWLRTVGEFEALSSLAAYRYEHPDDVWPEIVAEGAACFEATALGHPLIPAARMVPNDVRLSAATQLLVVSGSNMSGKSTLLRTVGINAVLALAGAPVRAAALRLTPVAVGATLRIQDSLQEGRSRFYAEITRIRTLADIARGRVPLLFLLDELFHGTNSHDRLVGAAGVLRSLLARGAIGLITTHDLALTAIADDLAPHAANVHFADHFDSGEIRFDYRLGPGPVTRSNAIALMRAVGLDVDT